MSSDPLPSTLCSQIVSSAGDTIATKTLEGVVTSWNDAGERMFGWLAEEIIGRPMTLVFPAEREHEEQEILARIARGERIEHFETVRRRKDGTTFYVSVTISPLRGDDGSIVGASKIARDISERVQREADFAQTALQARHLAAIVETSDDAIVSKTLQGIVTSWNQGAERIFGYSAQEMIGRPMTTVFPADRLDEEAHILERISRGERVEHFESVRVRKDGRLVNVSATISPLRDAAGRVVGASKIARDITLRIQSERMIWMQANFDTLTRLPNRRHFLDRLQQELSRARRNGSHLAVMFIDLDRFKEVNDSLGHDAGDCLLSEAAARLRTVLREVDLVARLGGDEFTVLLPDLDDPRVAEPVCRRLNEALRSQFQLGELAVHISGSIGVAVFPEHGTSADELMLHADQAMYDAKRHGRDQARYFTEATERGARSRLQLAADLRLALGRQELHLHYQPVVDLVNGSIEKFEALLRWQHPVHGAVSPAQFIPLAEQTGLIHPIGDWVFRTVARQALEWRGRFGRPVKIALNLSPVQLQGGGDDELERWPGYLTELGLPGDSIVLEITEGVMVDRSAETETRMRHLRSTGAMLAIDDFGTGYSSLAYLARLDVNFLKIDRSFVQALGKAEPDGREHALCEAIVVMAHKLGLKVIAEGVEEARQLDLLRAMGCDYGQGYYFARPSPPEEAAARWQAPFDASGSQDIPNTSGGSTQIHSPFPDMVRS